MKKLVRLLVLAAGAFLLFHGTQTVKAFSGDCVASIYTGSEAECYDCCVSGVVWEDVAEYVTDASFGPYSFYAAGYSCNGVLDSVNCNSGMCGSGTYQSSYADAGCCNSLGGGCANSSDCCDGLTCNSGNLCVYCNANGNSCSNDSDCCSGTCNGSNICQSVE